MPSVSCAGSELHVDRRGVGGAAAADPGPDGHSAHWGEPFLRALDDDCEVGQRRPDRIVILGARPAQLDDVGHLVDGKQPERVAELIREHVAVQA